MVSRKKRVVGKLYAKTLDETAFALELFRFPKLRTRQEKLVVDLHGIANLVRQKIGDKPKQYRMIRNRKVVRS